MLFRHLLDYYYKLLESIIIIIMYWTCDNRGMCRNTNGRSKHTHANKIQCPSYKDRRKESLGETLKPFVMLLTNWGVNLLSNKSVLMSIIQQEYDVLLRKRTLFSLGTHRSFRSPGENSRSPQQALKKYRKPALTFLCTDVSILNHFAAVTNSGWRRS